jgi:hypothetical protein
MATLLEFRIMQSWEFDIVSYVEDKREREKSGVRATRIRKWSVQGLIEHALHGLWRELD